MISVVTPCYNSTLFLRRLHASLLRQTCQNFEWVAVDDKSTDGTVQLLMHLPDPGAFATKIYALPTNSGGGVATGVGVEHTAGEVFMIIDHDDELEDFALQAVSDAWSEVEHRTDIVGLFFRRSNPETGRMIGGDLAERLEFTMSWLSSYKPDITDGVMVMRRSVALSYFNARALESICLFGVPFVQLTKEGKFRAGMTKPILRYHRDNPESQTNDIKVSRKTVYTYAKYIDAWDSHYFRNSWHWLRHMIANIKFSIRVHRCPWYHHRFIESVSVRTLSWLLMPAGIISHLVTGVNKLVDFPTYDFEQIDSIRDMRADCSVKY